MHYELTFIISAAVPETEHKAIQNEVRSYLEKIKAQISKDIYSLGRKKLAYAIAKQKHGFYVALEFDLEEATGLKELDTAMKHNHSILRHLVIKIRPTSAIKFGKRKPSDQRVQRSEPEVARPVVKPIRKRQVKAKPAKIDLENLDEKLDKILEDES